MQEISLVGDFGCLELCLYGIGELIQQHHDPIRAQCLTVSRPMRVDQFASYSGSTVYLCKQFCSQRDLHSVTVQPLGEQMREAMVKVWVQLQAVATLEVVSQQRSALFSLPSSSSSFREPDTDLSMSSSSSGYTLNRITFSSLPGKSVLFHILH